MACGSRRVEVRGNRRGTFPCEGSSRSGTVSWCARGSFSLLHTLSLSLSVYWSGEDYTKLGSTGGISREEFGVEGVATSSGQDLLDSYQPQRMVMDERTRTLTHTRVMDFGDFFLVDEVEYFSTLGFVF